MPVERGIPNDQKVVLNSLNLVPSSCLSFTSSTVSALSDFLTEEECALTLGLQRKDAAALFIRKCLFSVPPLLSPFTSIRCLFLTDCALDKPPFLGALARLEMLNLARNKLVSLSGCGLEDCSYLADLCVNDNQLASLPGNLPFSLKTLNVSRNKLTSLPSRLLEHFSGLVGEGHKVDVILSPGNPGLPAYTFVNPPSGSGAACGSFHEHPDTPPSDPPATVRATCAWVMGRARHVSISPTALASFAKELSLLPSLKPPPWEEWHYFQDAAFSGEKTAAYVAVLDTLNFCFWPCSGLEYDSLAIGLRNLVQTRPEAVQAQALSCVSEEEVKSWVHPPLPNMPRRLSCLSELGTGLARHFNGSALKLVQAAGGSAVELVRLILTHFPAFRDSALYRDERTGEERRVHFYKRAQILCGDLWAAFGHHTGVGGAGGGAGQTATAFHDIHALTAFADYRLPQLFREKGVLVYSAALSEAVDACRELPSGGAWECEIRAATVLVVESLRESGGVWGEGINSVQLDWLLWNAGEACIQSMRPHHRCEGYFY